MLNWLYRRSSLYHQQQTAYESIRKELVEQKRDFIDERNSNQQFYHFADNIQHILASRTMGTAMFFVPEIMYLLITCEQRNNHLDFRVYAPVSSKNEIAAADTIIPEAGILQIEDLRVNDDMQCKGIGSMLLSEIIFRAGFLKMETITANLYSSDSIRYKALSSFYSSRGFIIQKGNHHDGHKMASFTIVKS